MSSKPLDVPSDFGMNKTSNSEQASHQHAPQRSPNEERFRAALKNSPVVVFSQDTDLRYTWIYNPALGYKENEVIGRLDSELFEVREEALHIESLKRQVLQTGTGRRDEVTVHRNGIGRTYDLAIEPMRAPSGEIEGITCTATDVTERKEAERALQQHQLVLETLIESTTDFIYVKDRQGRYVFLNTAAAQSVNSTVPEVLGKDDSALFPPEDARQIMEKDRNFMNAGVGEVYEETHFINGSLRHLHTSKNICRDANGDVIGVVGISRDVTELKHAQAALITSEMNASGARMAHALAHEINNPLAAITNALYLLQRRANTQDALLGSAQEALDRITKITRQMIGLYNRNAPAQRLRVQYLVQDTLDSMISRFEKKGIRLQKQLEHCEFEGIEVDVRQLVAVLMENALEQSRGMVTVRLYNRSTLGTRFPSGFRLVIADNGPGIRSDYRNLVFEPFFSTKTEKASGLGLWVARGIVQKYGGSIRMRTSTKKGSSGTCMIVTIHSQPAYRARSPKLAS
jgi:PAS domain S-box-containing protein